MSCHGSCDLRLEANLHEIDPLGWIKVSGLIALFLDLIDEVPDAGSLGDSSMEEGSSLFPLLGISKTQLEFCLEGIPCHKVGQWLCEGEEVELILLPIVSFFFYVLEGKLDLLVTSHGIEDVVVVTLFQEGIGLVGLAVVFSQWCCFDSGWGNRHWGWLWHGLCVGQVQGRLVLGHH